MTPVTVPSSTSSITAPVVRMAIYYAIFREFEAKWKLINSPNPLTHSAVISSRKRVKSYNQFGSEL